MESGVGNLTDIVDYSEFVESMLLFLVLNLTKNHHILICSWTLYSNVKQVKKNLPNYYHPSSFYPLIIDKCNAKSQKRLSKCQLRKKKRVLCWSILFVYDSSQNCLSITNRFFARVKILGRELRQALACCNKWHTDDTNYQGKSLAKDQKNDNQFVVLC